MRQLKFPTYEYIKALPKTCTKSANEYEIGLPLEYEWKLFETPTSVKGTLSYNLDGTGYIYFDIWEGGYTGMNDLELIVKFNKANYTKLCKHAQNIFEGFYEALDRDCSSEWEDYINEVNK